jgi:hypothetical protein
MKRVGCSRHFASSINALTPWIEVLLKKLIFVQLVKNFPTFYATRMSITVFTRARR